MADDDESEWRFDLEEVGEDATGADDSRAHERGETLETADSEGDDAGVAGAVRGAGSRRPIEPGSPRIENVLFVVLGALTAIVLVADFLSLAGL